MLEDRGMTTFGHVVDECFISSGRRLVVGLVTRATTVAEVTIDQRAFELPYGDRTVVADLDR